MLPGQMWATAHGAGAASGAFFDCTTTGAAQTLTLAGVTFSAPTTVDWGDGSSDTYAAGAGARTHVYADAGTYRVRILQPGNVTAFDVRDNKVTLNSADIKSMLNVTSLILAHIKAGRFDSADVSAWRPSNFRLYAMPSGFAGTFDSADVSDWRPGSFWLFSMPATFLAGLTISANSFKNWTTGLNNFQMQDNSLSQAQVNLILWELYQAAITPRTATGGTINVGGTNAAPSGTYQAAASCPVDGSTPGAEIAHELINDGCTETFNTWSTVNITEQESP